MLAPDRELSVSDAFLWPPAVAQVQLGKNAAALRFIEVLSIKVLGLMELLEAGQMTFKTQTGVQVD